MSQGVDVNDKGPAYNVQFRESGPILSGNTISLSVPGPYPCYTTSGAQQQHPSARDNNDNCVLPQGSLITTEANGFISSVSTKTYYSGPPILPEEEKADVVVVSTLNPHCIPLSDHQGHVGTKLLEMTPRRKMAFGHVISELRTAQVVLTKLDLHSSVSDGDTKPILHSVSSNASQVSEDGDYQAPPPLPPAMPLMVDTKIRLAEHEAGITQDRRSGVGNPKEALEDSGFQLDTSASDLVAGNGEGVTLISSQDTQPDGRQVKEKDKELPPAPNAHRPLEPLHSTPVRGRRATVEHPIEPTLNSDNGTEPKQQQQQRFQQEVSSQRDPLCPDANHNHPEFKDSVRDRTDSYQASRSSVTRGSIVKELQEQLAPVIEPTLKNLKRQPSYGAVMTKEYLKGPDQMIPTDALTTIEPAGAVKLKIDERGLGSIPPISVPTLLQRTVMRHMDRPALCVKRNNKWITWTYKQYLHDVQAIAKAFIRLGLERFRSVCILGFNSPEWMIANLAAIHAGGFGVGIYTTNTPEACLHCFLNSQANIIVVENRQQLDKVLKVKDKIPTLKAIIQYTGKPEVEGVISWSQLLNLGNATADHVLEDRLKRIAVNQCCTIIYTSGTTGLPKGVLLSHDNLTWNSHASSTYMGCWDGRDIFISYLPLSHIAAQITEIYIPLSCGGVVYFANPDALKGSLVNTLREVRPTQFLGVPRVWEKMYDKMQEVGRSTKGLKKLIAKWAKGRGLLYTKRRMQGRHSTPVGFTLARALVFNKVRRALGFDRTRNLLSGAAPLPPEVAEFFASVNLNLMDAYGLSESTGPHTLNSERFYRMGSVGRTVPGLQTKIRNPDHEGNGEILMGGRDVFMGYLHDMLHTTEVINEEGWFHTGDVGQVDEFGFVYITGRLKEIIITAGGENVAPVLIENNIKAELPCVSNCVVVGDKKKFLAVLLTLKTEVDPVTQDPLPALTSIAKDWFSKAGLPTAETVDDVLDHLKQSPATEAPHIVVTSPNASLLPSNGHDASQATVVEHPSVHLAIQTGIDRANSKAISNAQRVQKWIILPVDFSISGGEIGPTMKLKRHYVTKKYAEQVDAFYAT